MSDDISNEKDPGDLNKPVDQISCKACNQPIDPKAYLCVECGSPQTKLSRFAYIHRSSWTAIGGIFAIVSAGVLIFNLMISNITLKNQQKIFIEDFQPRILLSHDNTFHLGEDSLKITFKIKNNGKTDAVDLLIVTTITTFPDSLVHTDTSSARDRMPTNSEIVDILTYQDVYGKTFFIRYFFTYKWVGENVVKKFEYYYWFNYNENTKKYEPRLINKDLFEQTWEYWRGLLRKSQP